MSKARTLELFAVANKFKIDENFKKSTQNMIYENLVVP